MAQQPERPGDSDSESIGFSSLDKVVESKDENFLRLVASYEPDECFKRLCSSELDGKNIFHIAASDQKNYQFMKTAMEILPAPVVQRLLCQEDLIEKWNPLHVSASECLYKMVKLILDYYRRCSSSASSSHNVSSTATKPWLQLDCCRRTPLHIASRKGPEQSAMEILSMDVELLSNMDTRDRESPLYLALYRGFSRVALKILTSTSTYSTTCPEQLSSQGSILYYAPNCSDEVFKLVLERHPHFYIGKLEGTVLMKWIRSGKLHAIDYIVNNNAIGPNLRRDFIDQLSIIDEMCHWNSVHQIGHNSHDEILCLKIAQVLVDAYRQERAELLSSPNFEAPWLAKDNLGSTPLHNAIRDKKEQVALYLFSLDKIKFLENDDNEDNLLWHAITGKCPKLAEEILNIVHDHDARFSQLLLFDNGRNPMHYAPRCTEAFLRLLLESYPQLMQDEDYDGQSILHSWIEIGQLWPFEYILKGNDSDIKPIWKYDLHSMLSSTDRKGRNPLHLAASSSSEQVMVEILKLIFDVDPIDIGVCASWRELAYDGDTPMKIALSNKRERLALLFLSTGYPLQDEEKYLMLEALEYECHKVVKFLLDSSAQHGNYNHCGDKFIRFGNRNILHLVWKSTEENAKFIIENWPELINENDEQGKKPLEKATEAGKPWLVKLILQKDRSSIIQTPLAWIEACKNGHVSTVITFVDHSPYFRYTCHEHKETPLHHIQKASYKEYRQLLEHQFINELKNEQNKDGETPLHIAIKSRNKDLAEVLLTTDEVDWNIKDNNNITAKDLLRKAYEEDGEWAIMCKAIRVDPTLKTTYIQVKTDLSQMRETISLVAALLATITFTAGFTVPGGFDQSKGFALLSTNPAFLVFLVSNTYAMCCSMLILFCVIWSVVSNPSKSSSLLDRSLQLLKQSLYGTLLAFMTGVYSVVHQKSLWVGIVVIVMSSIVVMLAQRQVLYAALAMLNYYTDKAPGVKLRLLSCWKRPSSIIQSLFRRNHGNAPNAAVSDNQTTQV